MLYRYQEWKDHLHNFNDHIILAIPLCLTLRSLLQQTLCYMRTCVSCGDNPPVVIMDLHKKGVFQFSVSDIEEPPENFQGDVNLETLWEALSKEMIGCGFVANPAHIWSVCNPHVPDLGHIVLPSGSRAV
ncbi:hypothetical protein DPX16_17845 [Anabarilius grahami]|uniref:Uncharacterized protein n=1 Tax=Anabarilius grahami TaxID=495550 RepID=A0A3N0YGL0_ANAGA|nr:hypothetical protein DPX16_17845 [Anabarilius grahami]